VAILLFVSVTVCIDEVKCQIRLQRHEEEEVILSIIVTQMTVVDIAKLFPPTEILIM
jgi:hypothetical protein